MQNKIIAILCIKVDKRKSKDFLKFLKLPSATSFICETSVKCYRGERMIELTYLKVLRKIYARLSESNVNWVVTGSFGCALQGLPVEVHDIDIQTDKMGTYEIEHLLSKFVIKKVTFSSTDKIRSHFGALMIDGVKVEIMGDIQKRLEDGGWESPVDLKLHKRVIEIEGMRVPVLSLEYEHQAYLKLGRVKKAEMLKKWLHGEHGSLNIRSPERT